VVAGAESLDEIFGVVAHPLSKPEVVVVGCDQPLPGLGRYQAHTVTAPVADNGNRPLLGGLVVGVVVGEVLDDDGCVCAVDLFGDRDLAEQARDLGPCPEFDGFRWHRNLLVC
jgi:hypothetical protein